MLAKVRNQQDNGGEDQEYQSDDGGGVENIVVERLAGVVEEGVVLDAHARDDGLGNLYVAALVGGGDDVEGGETEAEDGSSHGLQSIGQDGAKHSLRRRWGRVRSQCARCRCE